MATERSPHQHWYDKQRDTLLELGYDLADVLKRLDWILDNLPSGEDPATYIFPAHALWQEPSDSEQVQDSRVAWLADDQIPNKFKLILDAKMENP